MRTLKGDRSEQEGQRKPKEQVVYKVLSGELRKVDAVRTLRRPGERVHMVAKVPCVSGT